MPALKLTRRQSLFAALGALIPASLPGAAHARRPLRIGMIGSGHVGSTLGHLWCRAGHQVMFSDIHKGAAKKLASELYPLARDGTPQEAARFGDAVVLAVPYGALPQLRHDIGSIVGTKPLIDPSNPYGWRDGKIGRLALAKGAGVTTQAMFPQASVVRAFNSEDMTTLEAEAFRTPPRLALPMAGDVVQALYVAGWLIHDAGFDPVTVGPLSTAKLFQPGGPGFEARMNATDLRNLLGVTANNAIDRNLATQFSGGM
ncbi:NAD(P)-binding domain-containing protein [Komagataeibacter intermedius]|uniref:Oxidoreductase n=2 Tax=Komagataeibacter intermedius TaxID=66229 RepID=A0A0N1FAS3_9PROT|nr:NAD(P)-binding domain-containing protein [Komagataeibacter intermedius]KPH87568.1 oxidoreductase [Komagataeibacter intermedius AF2]MCF3636287.1 NAD(P)-binding domain-containing protein [Komagataeibacter intermedius]GAN88624.1 NADP oxidoreductase coenzyme F420-dependent [Komagataeibacter intermedius TF2]GBQ64411.1 oxidoreductase [Komagataeibacter intermedius NRIC 0521]